MWIESPAQSTVVSATDTAVSVGVWSVLVTGDPDAGPINAIWRTHWIDLVWERDDWKIDGVRVMEGPTPTPSEAALPSPPSEFEELDDWTPAVFAGTTQGDT